MLQEAWAKKGTTFGCNICRTGISYAFEASVKAKTVDRFVSEDTAIYLPHLLWTTHDFVDLFPQPMSCFQAEEFQPTVYHCTVCSHASEHPYHLPPNLLPFSITLSEMKGPELYVNTGKIFKQSEARPRKMNQDSYKQNCEHLGRTRRVDRSLHAMPSHFCIWHRKGKILISELKEQ